jgi:hypothetical protein
LLAARCKDDKGGEAVPRFDISVVGECDFSGRKGDVDLTARMIDEAVAVAISMNAVEKDGSAANSVVGALVGGALVDREWVDSALIDGALIDGALIGGAWVSGAWVGGAWVGSAWVGGAWVGGAWVGGAWVGGALVGNALVGNALVGNALVDATMGLIAGPFAAAAGDEAAASDDAAAAAGDDDAPDGIPKKKDVGAEVEGWTSLGNDGCQPNGTDLAAFFLSPEK